VVDYKVVFAMMRNKRTVFAVASCVFGVGLIIWGFRIGSESPQEKILPEKSTAAAAKPKRSHPTWQVALGNVVVLAPALGFNVKAIKGEDVDEARVSATIESQLLDLRELYRRESEANPNLMGAILLQLTIGASGEVDNVKELASRIPDGDFKRNLLEAASKWNFSQVVSSPVTITCPLLLVREGMDITTLLSWEKSLGLFEERSPLVRAHPGEQSKPADTQKQPTSRMAHTSDDASRQQKSIGKSRSNLVEITSTTPIRKEPSYKSSSISQVAKGTKLAVISVQGEWLEIRTNGSSGFIRKEFVNHVE
jgi:Bacterial SH3 domain